MTRIFLILIATFGMIAGEALPVLPGGGTIEQQRRMSLPFLRDTVINSSREAIQWLRDNPHYPDCQRWILTIQSSEVGYLHPSLVQAVDNKDTELGTIIMNRFREMSPNIQRLNLRNPSVLRDLDTFLRTVGGNELVALYNQLRSNNYQHAQAILRVKRSGLRFRTAAEAAAGGVVPPEERAGTEFLDPPAEEGTDFLGNPTTPSQNRR